MKIAICDDDRLELELAKTAVDEFIISKQSNEEISVKIFSSGDELLSYISKHGTFDLLVLDVIMPGMNGIELASEIRQSNNNCKIIFLTTSPEFAVKSYKVNALDYLLKPFSVLDFKSLLNKTHDEMGKEKSNSIVVKEKGRLTRVQINMIQYIESARHSILFHLRGDHTITCSGTMNEFHDILLSDKGYVKCHKSFIVNMNYVISISNKDFVLEDNTLVPISKHVCQTIKSNYIDYFFEKRNVYIL